MSKQKPLIERLYSDPVYVACARAVGYRGCLYRDLADKIEELSKEFKKSAVESAFYHLVTFEGQMRSNPSPLAEVRLRAEVRKLCWGLLGPPAEHPDYASFHPKAPEPEPPVQPAAESPSEVVNDSKPKRSRGKAG